MVGYFVKIHLSVFEQLLDAFDLLGYKVFFNGRVLGFGEELAQCTVIMVALFGQIV